MSSKKVEEIRKAGKKRAEESPETWVLYRSARHVVGSDRTYAASNGLLLSAKTNEDTDLLDIYFMKTKKRTGTVKGVSGRNIDIAVFLGDLAREEIPKEKPDPRTVEVLNSYLAKRRKRIGITYY